MHEGLANLSLEQEPSPLLQVPGLAASRSYSEHTAQAIDGAVKEIVAAAFARAHELLTTHRDMLEQAAQLLLQKETLNETQLSTIAGKLAAAQERALPKAA